MDGTVACRLVFLPEIISDSRFHVKAYVPVEIVADSGCGAYRELYALDAAEGRFPTAVARIGESLRLAPGNAFFDHAASLDVETESARAVECIGQPDRYADVVEARA